MDNKLQLIQEEVARINQISEYDNSVGSTKTLSNDLSKIVIHHTKQQSKRMLTESVSDTKDADFNLNNIFATMDGNYLIVEGQVVDLRTEESKGHIFSNDFRLYLEIAESQRDTLYREGLYEAAFTVNNTMLQISRRLMEHGKISLQEFDWSIGNLTDYLVPDFIATPDEVNKAKDKVVKYAEKKYKQVKEWGAQAWDDVSEFVGDGVDWIKDKAYAAWEWTKENFLAILAKGFIWIAQALEAALFSVAGIVVDVVLGFTGIGAIPMLILWGIVGVYRIYVWFQEGGWMNFLMVICCLMGMLPGGAVLAKAFRAGAGVLKGATTAASAAAKLGKAFKPSQVNWLSKVAVGLKDLLGSVFKAITWLTSKVPGFGGVAAKMTNIGSKIGNNLNKMIAPLTKVGGKITASSTTLGVLGGSVLGYEIYNAFHDGMNLEDIKQTELPLYDEYRKDPDVGFAGVGEPIGKASMDKGDFTVTILDDSDPIRMTWTAKKGSPWIDELMNHYLFDGFEMIEDEPRGADPTVWKTHKCSRQYGCPEGYEMQDGVAVEVEREIAPVDFEITDEVMNDYESYAEAELDKDYAELENTDLAME